MAPLIYPEPTWSNRFGHLVRTLQVVAIAGAIGAVGGGVAVMALVGGGSSSRPPTALRISTADTTKAGTTDDAAAHPINAAPAAPQPDAAAAAVHAAPPAAAAAAEAGTQQQSPAAAEPSPNDAAVARHPIQQAAEPLNSSAGTHVYNRVEPEQNIAPAPRARAKLANRRKNAERDRGQGGVPYPADRNGPYSGERYSYRNYTQPPAPRGYYFGGGVFYDRGGWGN